MNNIFKSASIAFKNIGTIRRFLSQSDYETMHPNYIIIINVHPNSTTVTLFFTDFLNHN